MALAGDVADNLEAVGQAHLGDLAQCRVRLLRRRRIDARADAALLRALLQGRHFLLRVLRYPRLANELIDRRHLVSTLRSGPSPGFTREPNGPRKINRAVRFPAREGARTLQRIAAE